ncbi:MAG: PCRF domain-containing protein, partial [Betaproteobacteria bacterium]|nr:PCRF domain-containing protein [Betaproteobacteria bacterium]
MDPADQLARLEKRLAELDREMADPNLYRQASRARDLAREHARIRSGTEAARKLRTLLTRKDENAKLLASTTDAEMRQLAEEESAEIAKEEVATRDQV